MSIFSTDILKNTDAYVPGEQPQDKSYIKLNTNEFPFPPSDKVKSVVSDKKAADLRLYPDPTCRVLKQAIAENYGLKDENVFCGNGSDEVLALSFLSFCKKEDVVVFPDISYGFYPVFASFFGLNYKEIPLRDDFLIDISDYFSDCGTVYIANPNAPTGLALSVGQIEEILKNNPNHVVVIDEAYCDFCDCTAIGLIAEYENLLIVRTFSKSYALAGARIGFALGSKELIADLEKAKFSFNPYNLNRLSIEIGAEAMKDREYFEKTVAIIKENRQKLTDDLRKLGFLVLDSGANFVFAKKDGFDGEQLYLKLKENGILVRHFGKERIKDYLRITVGTKEQDDALINTLGRILK
ncbi:MAG: histidinol-phosphate transaminase [Clostridia bacterium]|nr:histidinol-phosphate transaminase [Clostridia bacterium]